MAEPKKLSDAAKGVTSKFTDGHWEVGSVVTFVDDDMVIASGEAVVYAGAEDDDASTTTIRIEGPNALADARLIGAAVDLYSALSALLNADGRWRDYISDTIVDQATAVLAKARGET